MNKIDRARWHRAHPSTAEAMAWRVLRRLRREGLHVRRQHPVGPYFLDFAIHGRLLAIELDGPLHDRPEAQAHDARRDAFLRACGWRVVRLPSRLAGDPDALIAAVRQAAAQPSLSAEARSDESNLRGPPRSAASE